MATTTCHIWQYWYKKSLWIENKANLGGFDGHGRPSNFVNGQCDLEIKWMTLKNNHLQTLKSDQNRQFFGPCDLQIWQMTLKTTGHLFHAPRSFMCHFIVIGEFKLELLSGNTQIGSKSYILQPVWPWHVTDDQKKKKQRGHLFYAPRRCVLFHSHPWIAIGAITRKRQIGAKFVLNFVTLIFDLWPWPFAWSPLLYLRSTDNGMGVYWIHPNVCPSICPSVRRQGFRNFLKIFWLNSFHTWYLPLWGESLDHYTFSCS